MKQSTLRMSILAAASFCHALSQESSDPKMFHLDPGAAPADFKGRIQDLEWLVGNWRTDSSAEIFREDAYLPLQGGQISGVNRAIRAGKMAYANHITIWQDGDTVRMHHVNYGPDRKIRGDRDFQLLNKDGDYFYFTGLTLHRVNHNLQHAYFDFGNSKQLQITHRMRIPNQQLAVMELNTERELYPEGLAVDPDTNRIYLNSTNQRKIVVSGMNGGPVREVLTENRVRGAGLLFHKGLLYALGNNTDEKGARRRSILQVIDGASNRHLRTFEKISDADHFFNDVAVDTAGQAYISDNRENAIYSVDSRKRNSPFRTVLKSAEIEGANGICLSADGRKLFVATDHGIRILDLGARTLLPYKDPSTAGIDGLRLSGNRLYALQGPRLISFELDGKQENVIARKVLIQNHYTFDAPTSLSLAGDTIFVLGNSQFGKRSRIEANKLNRQELTNTFVLRFRE